VVEGVLGARGEPDLIDQLRIKQLVERRIHVERREKVCPETCADHRRCEDCALGSGSQSVDAGGDRRLHRRWHAHLGDVSVTDVATALTGQYTALHQIAHHLLCEERVTSSSLGDERRQSAQGVIRPQELAEQ